MPTFRGAPSLARDPLRSALLDKSRAERRDLRNLLELERHAPPPRNDLAPGLELELVPVDEITVPKRRARKLTAADIQQVKNSLQEFGSVDPILLGRDRRLIDGESRLAAAKELGFSHVYCINAHHLTPEQERALRVALNRIGAAREWDLGELRLELTELDQAGQPIANLGFASIELDQIFAVDDAAEKRSKAGPEDAQAPLVSQPGDLWQLGAHRLLCGDATDPACYQALLGDERVQLVIADPPYNVKISSIISTPHEEFVEGSGEMSDDEFDTFLAAFLACCKDVLLDGGIAFAFMDNKHLYQLLGAGKRSGYEQLDQIIWLKSAGGMGMPWRQQYEVIAAFKKPGKHKDNIQLGKSGRDRTNVWQVAGAGTVGSEARAMLAHHPTPKPPALLIEAMYDVTDRGDLVLDPFGGSGSTLIAAHRAERVARLIEKAPKYCDLILRRWLGETGIMPVHAQTGEPFDVRARAGDDDPDPDDGGEAAEVSHER